MNEVKIVSHITNRSLIYNRCVQIISRILIIVREKNVMLEVLMVYRVVAFFCRLFLFFFVFFSVFFSSLDRQRHGRGAQGGISSTQTNPLNTCAE